MFSLVQSSNSDGEIRLIDDAFGNICNLIIDISIRVRTKAAQLLGTMAEVSLHVLLQTLDKRLMADMRVSGIQIINSLCSILWALQVLLYN